VCGQSARDIAILFRAQAVHVVRRACQRAELCRAQRLLDGVHRLGLGEQPGVLLPQGGGGLGVLTSSQGVDCPTGCIICVPFGGTPLSLSPASLGPPHHLSLSCYLRSTYHRFPPLLAHSTAGSPDATRLPRLQPEPCKGQGGRGPRCHRCGSRGWI